MTQIWYHWNRVWIFVVLLIPVAFAVTAVLTRLRPSRSWLRSTAEVGIALGTLPWIWMILTPMELPDGAETVYLVPFTDLAAQLGTGSVTFMVVQVGGNLAVLFALGAFAPLRFRAMTRLGRLAILGATVSLVVELLQHAFVGGRVFSVDDVLLNAVGCVLGGLVTRRFWRDQVGKQEDALAGSQA